MRPTPTVIPRVEEVRVTPIKPTQAVTRTPRDTRIAIPYKEESTQVQSRTSTDSIAKPTQVVTFDDMPTPPRHMGPIIYPKPLESQSTVKPQSESILFHRPIAQPNSTQVFESQPALVPRPSLVAPVRTEDLLKPYMYPYNR